MITKSGRSKMNFFDAYKRLGIVVIINMYDGQVITDVVAAHGTATEPYPQESLPFNILYAHERLPREELETALEKQEIPKDVIRACMQYLTSMSTTLQATLMQGEDIRT